MAARRAIGTDAIAAKVMSSRIWSSGFWERSPMKPTRGRRIAITAVNRAYDGECV